MVGLKLCKFVAFVCERASCFRETGDERWENYALEEF